MKSSKKSMIVLFSILAVIGIAVGGCSMHQYQKKQEMIAIATSEEAKKVYENHMRALDPKALTDDGIIKMMELLNRMKLIKILYITIPWEGWRLQFM